MKSLVARPGVVVLLAFSAACANSGPASPSTAGSTAAPTVRPVPTPPPAKSLPPLAGPSRTFVFDRDVSYRVGNWTRTSRVTLYDNGAFQLQYSTPVEGGHRGGYADAAGVLTFEWEGWSAAGPWSATGVLDGDYLTIRYNEIMKLTDFEDAVYVLVR